MIAGLEFLAVAEMLIQGPTEAEWRSAVSRAYYAAFHEARQLMQDLRFRVPRGEKAHAYLWLGLFNCREVQAQGGGSDLNQLRTERNRADYDIGQSWLQTDALLLVQATRRIIQILDAAGIDPTRTQITDAMRVYERDVLKQVTWGP